MVIKRGSAVPILQSHLCSLAYTDKPTRELMAGLKITGAFLILIACTYLGVLFVESNHEEIILAIGTYQTQPMSLGLAILTSLVLGVFLGTAFAGFEIFSLWMKNRSLKKKLKEFEDQKPAPVPPIENFVTSPSLTSSPTSNYSYSPTYSSTPQSTSPRSFSISEPIP